MRLLSKNYECKKEYLHSSSQRICYRIYKNTQVTNGQKLVLIHGAGVAGEDTWLNIVNFLVNWEYVLVPDLRGMGETFALEDLPFVNIDSASNDEVIQCNPSDIDKTGYSVFDLVSDLKHLIDHLNWDCFDLGGYSLGGLVSMLYKQSYSEQIKDQFLLEPGLLDRAKWSDTTQLREKYASSVKYLRNKSVREGVENFLNAISPNRKTTPASQELAIQRLMHRPIGFANALSSVNEAIHDINREELIRHQGNVFCMIGGLSVTSMHEYHQTLEAGSDHWHYFNIVGTDHSLPYQKPRQIARIFNNKTL